VDTGDREVVVELLAHDYAWESYHSVVNEAGANPVPAKSFALNTGLVGSPQTFDYRQHDARLATLTRAAPDGFSDGNLLYARRDLLASYARSRGRLIVPDHLTLGYLSLAWCYLSLGWFVPFRRDFPTSPKSDHLTLQDAGV
jgi:hypothetical protein